MCVDEKGLSIKIKDYLNRNSLDFKFKFIDDFCDLADKTHKIYIEVKPNHFAFAQILHAIAREGIKNAKYIGVANSNKVLLYKPPEFSIISSFSASIDPERIFTPSQVDKPELNERAKAIMGEPFREVDLEFPSDKYFYITLDNLKSIKPIFEKYDIHFSLFVDWLDGVREDETLVVNKEGWIVNVERPDIFTNEHEDEKRSTELTEFGGFRKAKHKPIREKDIAFFESLRIRHEDLAEILHEIDSFMPQEKRRNRGVFWTEEEIGDRLSGEILSLTNPDLVVEPCVGGGSLLNKIAPRIEGVMNDIDKGHVEPKNPILSSAKFFNITSRLE